MWIALTASVVEVESKVEIGSPPAVHVELPQTWKVTLPVSCVSVSENVAVRVGVVELDSKHAFANIALTDNVVRFATRRYCDNPLIVQGPGAGPEVTAGGVFADLLRLAAYLGARL